MNVKARKMELIAPFFEVKKMNTRGRQKIEGAIAAFKFDFRGKTVLDIGSSTGGFTESALSHGASKVIAVEKGKNQMVAPLRFDARVELHEQKDIFQTTSVTGDSESLLASLRSPSSTGRSRRYGARCAKTLPLSLDALVISVPDVVVADVSFVSLRDVLLYVKEFIAGPKTEYLVMMKPQFEARPEQLNKGIVKNEKMRREIIKDFEFFLKKNGFLVVNKHDNETHGKHGNIERFYYLKTV